MDEARLADALTGLLDQTLASEIAADFVKIRHDCATGTLERASPGKFVETFVQCLQFMATGNYESKPNVDGYLSNKVENEVKLPEGLRICGARIARSIYTLRNKRSIAHKNSIEPNAVDLTLSHSCAAWLMSELLRHASSISMHEAGTLIQLIHTPVGTLVEEIDGARLVHAKTSIKGEILILLHSYYPEYVIVTEIVKSMQQRNLGSIKNRISEMRTEKLLYGNMSTGFRLTQAGHTAATGEIERLTSLS